MLNLDFILPLATGHVLTVTRVAQNPLLVYAVSKRFCGEVTGLNHAVMDPKFESWQPATS